MKNEIKIKTEFVCPTCQENDAVILTYVSSNVIEDLEEVYNGNKNWHASTAKYCEKKIKCTCSKDKDYFDPGDYAPMSKVDAIVQRKKIDLRKKSKEQLVNDCAWLEYHNACLENELN